MRRASAAWVVEDRFAGFSRPSFAGSGEVGESMRTPVAKWIVNETSDRTSGGTSATSDTFDETWLVLPRVDE